MVYHASFVENPKFAAWHLEKSHTVIQMIIDHIHMSNRLYLEKNGIACGWKHFFFQIHRAYGNEVGGNPKTR